MSDAVVTSPADITAVILSAGLSRRMGRFKPLLPLGTKRTIEWVVDLFRAGGIEEILVVAGHRAPEVRRAVEPLNVRLVTNPDYQQGMFTSVLAGVRALPDRCRAFFIHPVDIPLVRPRTVQRLTETIKDHPADLLYPTFDGRRGHPTLVRTCLVPPILRWTGDGGLKACLRRHEADSFELPVVDEAILLDLDTPGDYDRMQARLATQELPSDAECRVLMEQIQHLPPSIAEHCQAVARVALRLAQAVKAAGAAIDIEPVRMAALLHDIARTRKNHAQAGAQLLTCHGFDRLAPIVGAHMDLDVRPHQPIDAAQVVFLADKLMEGDRYADMEQRFRRKMEKYGSDSQAVEAIERRLENARLIKVKVEKMTGRTIEAIVENLNAQYRTRHSADL